MNTQNFFGKTKLIYFIGIGGHGMSALARAVFLMGYEVIGSDCKENDYTKDLLKLGIKIKCGPHDKKNILPNIDVVVTSSAISPQNPEMIKAKEKGIPIILRGEMLAEIMRLKKKGVAIAGTHGKTTTTAMIATIFNDANLTPTTIVGGQWLGIKSNAQIGKGDYMISEADESDGSFLKLSPKYSVVTNIDWDHVNFYKNKENLLLHFLEFINKVPFYGTSVLCLEDENIVRMLDQIKKPFIGYALEDDKKQTTPKKMLLDKKKINLLASNEQYYPTYSEYDLSINQGPKIRIKVNIAGRHNILNSLAAIGVAIQEDIPMEAIVSSLAKFQGVFRRMSRLGIWRGFEIIDDYGHHPNEILATLTTIKKHYTDIIVIFQPHRYTRLAMHYVDIAKALIEANRIYLAPVYNAGEESIENISTQLIMDEIKKIIPPEKKVFMGESIDAIYKNILENEKKSNKKACIIAMGAGDIYKLNRKINEGQS